MSGINAITTQAITQWIGGSLIGTLVDSNIDKLFPPTTSLMSGVHVAAQLVVDGILTYAWFDWATRRGYANSNDPTKGVFFIMSFMNSQPRLKNKMQQFNQYVTSMIGNFDLSKMNQSGSKGINNTKNMSQDPNLNQHQIYDYSSLGPEGDVNTPL
jgi:hypothetical protein